MVHIIDLSVPIVQSVKTESYGGHHAIYKPGTFDIEITKTVDFDTPGVVGKRLSSRISAPVHAGTHIDAPLHRDPNGRSIDQIEVERFMGELHVIDMHHKVSAKAISAADLEEAAPVKGKMERLLVRTGWYKKWGTPEYLSPRMPYYTPDAIDWLLSRGVKLLLMDFKVDPYEDEELPLIKKLLSNDCCLVTPVINLDEIKKNKATVYAFPIKIKGVEAAMTRVIVVE